MINRFGPVCSACGGPFYGCGCTGMPKPAKGRVYLLERLSEREAEVRAWAGLIELGLAMIMVGLLILLV